MMAEAGVMQPFSLYISTLTSAKADANNPG